MKRVSLWTLALMAAATLSARAQVPWARPGGAARHPYAAPSRPRPGAVPLRVAAATATEQEPNDSISQATLIAVGDTVAGELKHGPYPETDIDYYAVDLAAGTVVSLEVDAYTIGSWIMPVMRLFGPDSTTTVAWSCCAILEIDDYLQYFVPVSGRYFIKVYDWDGRGGPGGFYQLKVGLVPQGPGDPTSVFASTPSAVSVAASAGGDLYVLLQTFADGYRIQRVTPQGSVSELASIPAVDPGPYAYALAMDGFGNLLVTVDGVRPDSFEIRRYSPAGGLSRVFVGHGSAGPITVGPDGDVWAGVQLWPPDRYQIWRFSPDGVLKDSVSVPYAASLAFAPSGELHFTAGSTVFKLAAHGAEPVIALDRWPESDLSIAFDRDGYLYVGDPSLSRVHLYSPSYVAVDTPFAVTRISGVSGLAFGRTVTGEMTSRLFVVSGGSPSTLEVNPAGVRAPGFHVGVDLLPLRTAALRSGFMGVAYADTVRLADPPGLVVWRISWGALPPGLSLDSASGVVSGVPVGAGEYRFSVIGTSGGRLGNRTFTLEVGAPAVDVAAAAAALLGGPPLPQDVQRYLDMQGNNNGRFDLADLRALLKARALLPAVVQASSKGRAP